MSKVYVLYTGGTIGCMRTPDGLAPMDAPAFAALVNTMPGLADGKVAEYPGLTYEIHPFVSNGQTRILDSSNMVPQDWVDVADQIAANYAAYDGFVVLHGTDTMAFTASALSFLLDGLTKPVVLTGSQVPLSFTLNDALPNLAGALTLAGGINGVVPEVCVYFDSLLLRGNRSVKADANGFAAFQSPNFPPLARVGTVTTVNRGLVLPMPRPQESMDDPTRLADLRARLALVRRNLGASSVVMLSLFPGIQATSMLEAVLASTKPPVKGLVLLAFGEGNGPSTPDFIAALKAATTNGVLVMDNTQVQSGSVESDAYATGLGAAGAISAGDMTPMASLAKLVYFIGEGRSYDDLKVIMQMDLRGELTPATYTTAR